MREEYCRQIIESLPYAIIITDQQGRIEEINAQTALLFGYSQQELHDKKIDILIPERFCEQHHKDLDSQNDCPPPRQAELGRNLFGLTKEGDEFPVRINLSLLENNGNNKILTTIIDMSEQSDIVRELKRVKKELNDFVDVASHDLKAPLRGIRQLSSWIEEDITDFASDNTKNNLALMMQRTARLERYLKDLIIYSRISHVLDDAQNINIKALVLSVFDLQSPPKEVSIVCEETLPEITTFITPLETVFSHLINNAIKHKNKGQLTINVSSQEYPTHYSFSVKDNGPGILERNHEYVFDLFKTIKPRDEVEGSGMGLSIIRKLLDSLNCVISVSSDGKNGSCFTFTWPKR
ncbi:hypothetical protein A3Q34_02470 [Colwellia sp. PAMC 20917]|uniref:sensor histidine kinase n=1 Tax=Colwellia sp. PAMC 20917 TaxID=1816218 RepID=UPI0008782329|nr:PAS domain-containing sensor histidine kinase [Colwellia sp. PAMC 20917]AOW75819.1 hypothetical protein A3Q34_02470 [Colwellia sp. PAMC 20917]